MSRDIIHYGPSGSMRVGDLPEGCTRCINGEKVVLYTTGHCSVGCAYCPIPEDRQKLDDVFINEQRVNLDATGWQSIVDESDVCLAQGAGITGGDPMEVPDRTIAYIRQIRAHYGPEYHLHLYTSGIFFNNSLQLVDELFKAGLDELRFHPKNIRAKPIWEFASRVKATYPSKTIGFEVPAIPGQEQGLIELITFADKAGMDFVNLNEYEFTSSNFDKLDLRGFVPFLMNSAVVGSRATVETVLNATKDSTTITIHFCSSGSKDSIQLANRFKRRASTIRRPFDEISAEGELEYGIIYVDTPEELELLLELLPEEYEVDPEMFAQNSSTLSVETAWYIVDTIINDLRSYLPHAKAELIARHPIENGPITWVDPR